MRIQALLAAAALLTVTGCGGDSSVATESASAGVIPAAVSCGDAPALRQRAADDRRRIAESRSDQERISVGSRANLLASLAVIADLKCKVTLAEADEALKPALEAARKAAATKSVYEKTRGFNEASFAATGVVEALLARIADRAK